MRTLSELLLWIVGLAVATVSFFVRRQVLRGDDHGKRIRVLEADGAVNKAILERVEKQVDKIAEHVCK